MPKAQLNEQQKEAIFHKQGPLLVVAGAGTGKTRVITERIRHLIQDENISPKEILALTFTEKASQEMLDRVSDIMPLGYEEPWIYTFHGFADRLLRAEGLEIGIDPSYKILSDSDQWLLMKKHLFSFDIKYFRPLGNPSKFISAILKFISRLQDENIGTKEFTEFAKNFEPEGDQLPEDKVRYLELAHLYEQYEQLKLKKSKMDFGDLITWTLKLFIDRPNILKKYQNQFKHVFIDEFQDTNFAQYEVIKLLFPKREEQNLNRSLLVVGDDSQSIYKFRGAAVSNIMQFMQDFPTAKLLTLTKNYRSTQKILDPSYTLVQNNNPDTLEVKLGISKQLSAEADTSPKKAPTPKIVQVPTLDDEVHFVIEEIVNTIANDPTYEYKDFAILARANSHLDPFIFALRKYELPYQLVGNRGLYDTDEVRDIISLLQAVVNPRNSVSLYRTLNIPTLKLNFDEIVKSLTTAKYNKTDLWNVISSNRSEEFIKFIQQIEGLQKQITKETPSNFTFKAMEEVSYISQYSKEETVENQLRLKNLNLFLEKIKRFEVSFREENKQLPNILDYLEYLELVIEAGENPGQAEIEDINTVNLMTVHASKGLEFKVVFIVNMVADRFPSRDRKDQIQIPDQLIKETLPTGDEHIQEERRLFYVAMTRAQKKLFITLAKDYGGKRAKVPSGFLTETGLPITEITSADPAAETPKQESLFKFSFSPSYINEKQINLVGYKPTSLSYSQLENYETCGLKYKYNYILKIPVPPSSTLEFGNSIHYTLRDFHTKKSLGQNQTLDDLLKLYELHWSPLGYESAEHRQVRFDSGKELLAEYFERNKDKHVKHLALEKGFNLQIGEVKFTGRIDRIDISEDGTIEVIDYKTGNPKTQKEVDKDKQISVYAMAAKEAFNIIPNFYSLYFLEPPSEKISTTRGEEQILDTKQRIKETLDRMKSGSFEATPGMHCSWCDYREICPFGDK